MKFLFAYLLLILCAFSAPAQAYTTYYNSNNVSGKIYETRKIYNYKYQPVNELKFYNDGSSSCTVIGWVKIRYTELSSGKTDYKEKRFTQTIPAGQNRFVNCYFKPSWSRYSGKYEPVGFYVESVTGGNNGGIYRRDNGFSGNGSRKNTGVTRTVTLNCRAFYWDGRQFFESESAMWHDGNKVTIPAPYTKYSAYGIELYQTTAVDSEHNSYWYIPVYAVEN